MLKLLQEALNDEGSSKTFHIEKYFQVLHIKNCLCFRWFKIWLHIYMTPTMRANWERYGDVLFLDMMKQQINSAHWSYIGPCILNGDKQGGLVCEGIICALRESTNIWNRSWSKALKCWHSIWWHDLHGYLAPLAWHMCHCASWCISLVGGYWPTIRFDIYKWPGFF